MGPLSCEIELEIKGRHLHGFLFIACRARKVVCKGIGDAKVSQIKSEACTEISWPFVVLDPSRNASTHYLAYQYHPAIR